MQSSQTSPHLELNSAFLKQIVKDGWKRYETNFTEYDTLTKGPLYEVFRVQNKIDKSIYAIKKINLKLDGKKSTETKIHRVVKEVRYLAQLNHPNIIRYYNSWIEPNDSDSEKNDSIIQSPLISPFRHIHETTQLGDLFSYNSFEYQSTERISYSEVESDDSEHLNINSQIIQSTKLSKQPQSSIAIYIQTEYCNQNLENYILSRNQQYFKKQITMETIYKDSLQITKCLIAGLNYIHIEFKVIHRALKPNNIFINNPNEVKIGDLGLVRKINSILVNQPSYSEFGYIHQMDDELSNQDSNYYIAPEQHNRKCNRQFDHKIDIYALGIIMLRLFHPTIDNAETNDLVQNAKSCIFHNEKQEILQIIKMCLNPHPNERISLMKLQHQINQLVSRKQSEELECIIGELMIQFEDEDKREQKYLTISQKQMHIFKSNNNGKAQVIYDLSQCQVDANLTFVDIKHPQLASLRIFCDEDQLHRILQQCNSNI